MYKKSIKHFFIYIKIPTKCYDKNKQRLQKEAVKAIKTFLKKKKNKRQKRPPKDIKIFFEKEKEKKSQYYRERNKSLYEDQKQRLVEYRRYYITQKVTAWVA